MIQWGGFGYATGPVPYHIDSVSRVKLASCILLMGMGGASGVAGGGAAAPCALCASDSLATYGAIEMCFD